MAFNASVTKAQVEAVLGCYVEMWNDEPNAVSFRPSTTITFQKLQKVSDLFGTERIDLNAGREGEPDYSSVTPGCPAEPGEITVYRN